MARFFRRGKSVIRFAPAVANKNAPTRAEINAGTNISDSVADMAGFQLANNPISTPDMGSAFVKSIIGEDTVDASSLTFYDDDAASAIRTTLAKGVAGFILLMPYGDVSTKRVEVWPVRSTGVNDEWTTGNEPARYMVAFAHEDTPAQSATIPA